MSTSAAIPGNRLVFESRAQAGVGKPSWQADGHFQFE